MYFALGALVATFVALLVLPAVWHRAVRLTTRRVEAAVPISIFEIQADKDQQRAFFALNQRRLELQGDAMRDTIVSHAATIEHQRQKIVELEAALAELTGRHKLLEATHAEQSVLVGELQDQLADQQARATAADAASVVPPAEGASLPAVAPVESPAAASAEGVDLQEAALALSVAPLRAEQEQLKAAVLAAQRGAAVLPGKLKNDLMNVAAQLTAMVARMEGEGSPIPGLVATPADDEAANSLAARIRTLLAATAEAPPPDAAEAPRPLAHVASA